MNCKKVRDLILGDYIDNELSERLKQAVEGHLHGCCGCREYLSAVRSANIASFDPARRFAPPDCVWQAIRGTLDRQEVRIARPAAGLGGLRIFIFRHKPVFALSSAMAVVLIAALFLLPLNNQRMVREHFVAQADFLAKGVRTSPVDSPVELETGIEYFLL